MSHAQTNLFQDLVTRSKKNLGTFTSDYIEPSIQQIFYNYIQLNGIDTFAYPEFDQLNAICKKHWLKLTHANKNKSYEIMHTAGSSESILIALIHLRQRHQTVHEVNLQPLNLIISDNSHMAWRKAAKYLNIKLRVLPLDPLTHQVDYQHLATYIDEHTIGLIASSGNPLTMLFDDIENLNHLLERYYLKTGQWLPIHIDAASGGLLNPFQYPNSHNDFRSNHVISMNISSHKYGLLPPSMGWLLIEHSQAINAMADISDYIGRPLKKCQILYSHSAAYLIAQYYVFEVFGLEQLGQQIEKLYQISEQLRQHLKNTLPFNIASGQHAPGCMLTSHQPERINALSQRLKNKGWLLPTYALPCGKQAARIVIKHGHTNNWLSHLLDDVLD